ncbi:hypothetical protein D6D01_02544 [Aureobasidium pullulans]|uniref:Uncharacterized protein n=1 Tax=Aureobasidium pullulans TaxID=5580 RepID=A0A4S9LRQ2_AURPU|nr:hypothetical protein D6D01_02544 [Aureobasidium pullulans]
MFGANLFPYSHCFDHWSRARKQMEERRQQLYRQRRLDDMDPSSGILTEDPRPSRLSREVPERCPWMFFEGLGQIVTEEPGTLKKSIEKRDSPLEDETGENRAPSESPTPGTDTTSLETKMENLDPYPHSQPELTDRGSMLRPGICPYRARQNNGQVSTSQIIPSQNTAQEPDLQPARSEPTAQGSSSSAGRWKCKGRRIGGYANGFVPSGDPIQEEDSEPDQSGPSGHASRSHTSRSKGKQRKIEWNDQHHANEDATIECVMGEADFQVAQPGSSAHASSSGPSGSKGKQRQIDSQPPTTEWTHYEYLMRATGSTTFPGLCRPAENQSAEIKEAVATVSYLRPSPEDLPRYITLDSLNLDPGLRIGCIEHSMAMSVRIQNHVCPELEPCWSPACSKSVPPCRFADSYFEYGKMPCHWGMGKILRDHAETFGEESAMKEDPADIMRAYRWRHQKDQRHQGDESCSKIFSTIYQVHNQCKLTMNNDAETETQSTEFQGPELRDLLLDSCSDERTSAHPRQEAHRRNHYESSARRIPLPSGISFCPAGFASPQDQQNAIDDAKKAKKDHDDARKTGYAPWTPTIWYSSGLHHSTTEDPSQALYGQPPMDPKIFEFKMKHEKSRCPGHIAWRNRVIQVWKESRFSDIRQCTNADTFHSDGTKPCKWGWGRIFHEYALAHDRSKMENDDLNSILEWFRQQHVGEPRFQGLQLGLQFPITDARANKYWVPVQSSEAP